MTPLIINAKPEIANTLIDRVFRQFTRKKALLLSSTKSNVIFNLLQRKVKMVLSYDLLFIKDYDSKFLTNDIYTIADTKQLIIGTNGDHAVSKSKDIDVVDFSNWNKIDQIEMIELYTDLITAKLQLLSLPHTILAEDFDYPVLETYRQPELRPESLKSLSKKWIYI